LLVRTHIPSIHPRWSVVQSVGIGGQTHPYRKWARPTPHGCPWAVPTDSGRWTHGYLRRGYAGTETIQILISYGRMLRQGRNTAFWHLGALKPLGDSDIA